MNRLMSNDGDILTASERTLSYFVSCLAGTVKHSTIKLHLSAVRNLLLFLVFCYISDSEKYTRAAKAGGLNGVWSANIM